MDRLPFLVLKGITDCLDLRQRARCTRINSSFEIVSDLPSSSTCIPFTYLDGFAAAVNRYATDNFPPMVIFSAAPNVRYIGNRDADALYRFCFIHGEVRKLVLNSVCFSSTLMMPAVVTDPLENLSMVTFMNSILRVNIKFGPAHRLIWELPIVRESISSTRNTTLEGGMKRLKDRIVADAFLENEEANYIWLGQALAVIQQQYVNEKAVICRIIHYVYPAIAHLTIDDIQLDQIDLHEIAPRDLAYIAKYIQTFAPMHVLQNTVLIPGSMYRL